MLTYKAHQLYILGIRLVQVTFLVGITPAALGFLEWGWVGGLILLLTLATEAANYAVMHRLFLVASVVIVSLKTSMVYGLFRLRSHRPVGSVKGAS